MCACVYVCVYKYHAQSVCPHGIFLNIVLLHKIDISSFIGFICSHFFLYFFAIFLFHPLSSLSKHTNRMFGEKIANAHTHTHIHLNRQRFQNNKRDESVSVNVCLHLYTCECVLVLLCMYMHVLHSNVIEVWRDQYTVFTVAIRNG